ncbi:MAG: hypothetical protein QOD82_4427 [Pseudonocardiales bacterium]|nr:hypothetical protein [Pseudonocardiales bacterium]
MVEPRRQRHIPEDDESGVLLGRDFIAAVVVFHEEVGRRLGLSATDRKCLDLICRGPVTAGELARYTGLTTGAITGMIDRLVAAGYVERRPDPVDRRQTWVSRRPGSALDEVLPAIFGPLGEDMRKITDGYSAHELEAIGDFLSRTREVLVTHTARLTAKPAPPERERSRRAPKAPRDA